MISILFEEVVQSKTAKSAEQDRGTGRAEMSQYDIHFHSTSEALIDLHE